MGKVKSSKGEVTSSAIRMADVGKKAVTCREATASGRITMSDTAMSALRGGRVPKGDPIPVARLAGVMAAKEVHRIVPLCHQVPLDAVDVGISLGRNHVDARVTVRAKARTGVEMEALTGVSASLLSIYDMLKKLDRAMVISSVRVDAKSGGRSGDYRRS